jgi:sugar O-acyltransferase (sialic acid O-acetyltransferase NeuD family)
MTPIILLGPGGNYADIIDTIEDINAAEGPRYEILGFLDNREELRGQTVNGLPVLGRFSEAARFEGALFSTWIGGVTSYLRRPRVLAELGVPPERFVTLVHPTSYVSRRARLGHGVVVYQNCTIANNVTLGDHVLVLPNTVISHDDLLGDYTVVTGSVAIAGNVTVGRNCYLGSNSSIHHAVTIGEGSLIGMGSVVLRDVPPYHVMVGNPARVLRTVSREE